MFVLESCGSCCLGVSGATLGIVGGKGVSGLPSRVLVVLAGFVSMNGYMPVVPESGPLLP